METSFPFYRPLTWSVLRERAALFYLLVSYYEDLDNPQIISFRFRIVWHGLCSGHNGAICQVCYGYL